MGCLTPPLEEVLVKKNSDFGALNSNHDSHLVDDLGHYI
jgi:hypothetical protein